jgi:FAD binding domain/Berberine and berberine like
MDRRNFVARSLAVAIGAQLPFGGAFAAVLAAAGKVDADLDAVTGAGKSITLEKAALQELGDSLRGNLILRGHPAYEEARRVRNPSISRYPALIVQPTGVTDVRHAVDFARSSNLLVAVKCGGHSHSGKSTCNGGMLIDLSLMRGVRVDPKARIAYVEGGSLLGDMDHETMALGLVTTAGTVSHTGVGGLTLGGGFGRVARRFGLSLDNLRAVDIVTADGQLRRASADENPDLYWGVRGGGGNFGVVTSFEFQLHPMDREVIGGNIVFPLSQAKQLLEFYSEYQLMAPDELSLDAGIYSIRGVQGQSCVLGFCYSGPRNGADAILKTLRSAGKPIDDTVKAMDYVALQRSGDDTDPRGVGSYTKSGFSAGLTPAFIDAILTGFEARPERGTIFAFQQGGGAINRIAADATAFPHRDITLTPLLVVDWAIERDASADVAWLKQYWASIEPHIQGFYTNDLIDETQKQVDENYLGNYPRLVALKNRYDPTNLFRLNANVIPKA